MRRNYLFLILICLAVLPPVNSQLKKIRTSTPDASLLYIPSGKYLKVATLGFDNLAADLLYLWSIQFYGDRRIVSRYQYLEHIYGIITDLDPAYVDAYIIGALIIGLEGNDVETAMRILNKGMAANPNNWIFAANAGYFAWLDLDDYKMASEYFRKASQDENCPGPIRRLFGVMLEKAGDTRSSLRFWKEIHKTSDDKDTLRISRRFIRKLTIKLDIEILTGVLTRYKKNMGRAPVSWQDVIKAGLLNAVPLNPDGEAYLYNGQTEKIEGPSENAY